MSSIPAAVCAVIPLLIRSCTVAVKQCNYPEMAAKALTGDIESYAATDIRIHTFACHGLLANSSIPADYVLIQGSSTRFTVRGCIWSFCRTVWVGP